mgnify:CR=1 FL=1|tara:strand:- start:8086 stop:8739 length:654 start_codon:yes stop_codon:yes gene_type:complete
MIDMAFKSNLDKYIQQSGYTKEEVARRKGIAPESLSRHISGRSKFSVQDAIEYANILGTRPEQILFDHKQIKVFGFNNMIKIRVLDNSERQCYLTSPFPYKPSVQVIVNEDCDDSSFNDHIIYVDTKYMEYSRIQQQCYGAICVIKCSNNIVSVKKIYPNPPSTNEINGQRQSFTCVPHFSVQGGQVQTDVVLQYAMPILSVTFRPDLIGLEFSWRS